MVPAASESANLGHLQNRVACCHEIDRCRRNCALVYRGLASRGQGGIRRAAWDSPVPILLAATVPLLAFLAAYWASHVFHQWVLAIDLPLAAAIQAWRAGGLGFLALYAHGVLPGAFAWPAGLGDIAIGVTTPWVALALFRRPGFAAGRGFAIWNLLGILDLVVAVTAGAMSSLLASGAPGEVTTAPMAQLPLVLIPAFLVPLFVMLHLAGLFQAQRRLTEYAGSIPWAHGRRQTHS